MEKKIHPGTIEFYEVINWLIKELKKEGMTTIEKHLGRDVKEKKEFDIPGDFQSYYAAQCWVHANGYEDGSMDGLFNPIALVKGEYNLAQKWHNICRSDRKKVDGVMYCPRNGKAIIYIFN